MNGCNENDAAKIILFSFIGLLICSLPLSFASGNLGVILGYMLPQLLFIGVALVYLKLKAVPFLSVVPVKKTPPLALVAAVCVTAGVFLQNLILGVSFTWLLDLLHISASVSAPDLSTAGGVILAVFAAAVLPAVGEELIYRGILLSSLRKRGDVYAVLVSAAIFALSHLNPAQLVYQFMMGVATGYVVIKTGNVLYAAIIHFLSNLLVLVLPLLLPAFDSLAVVSLAHFGIMAAMSAAGILILYPSFRFLIKTARRGEVSPDEMKFLRFFGNNQKSICYNNPSQPDKIETRFWFYALIIAFAGALILSVVLSFAG